VDALNDIISTLTQASHEDREAVMDIVAQSVEKWVPSPGPQTEAYFCEADCLLYGGEPGGGKGLDLNTPIPTPSGFTTMGDLKTGDTVFDKDGKPCTVTFKSEIHNRTCFKVTFSDGSIIVTDDEHQWLVRSRCERLRAWRSNEDQRKKRRAQRKPIGTGKRPDLAKRNAENAQTQNLPLESVLRTDDLVKNIRIGTDNRLNYSVDVSRPIDTQVADLPIDPYVLGAWLGDGTSSAANISGVDVEIFQNISAAGYRVTSMSDPNMRGIIGLQTQLRQLNVLNNKHIPPLYLRASINQRIALLQGLMDTDGHCDKRGQCEIQLTCKPLIDSVHELLSTLGIKAQMHEGEAKLYGRITGPKWRLKFQTEIPAFRLSRKLARQKQNGFRGTHSVRYITAIKEVESRPTQCIQVNSPSRTYLCGKAMIPTHNTQLLLGLAFNEHKKSMLMRRQYTDLDSIIDDAVKIHGSEKGLNRSAPPKFKISGDQTISFRATAKIGDEKQTMGKARDLLGIDEATHFAKEQIRFMMGWVRSEDPNQRCRTVLATNPPLTPEGLWVVDMFAPWLDPRFPNPAKHGELRWVVSDEDGHDLWVNGPDDSRIVNGKEVFPTSRTYIPSSVKDNPFYAGTDYEKTLDGMSEPFRSLLMGGFRTEFKDAENQLIPTQWVLAAQQRWTPIPPENVPMCAIGVDCTGGGDDPLVMAPRYDGWYDKLSRVEGKEIPIDSIGSSTAGHILKVRQGFATVILDMGGGYGGPAYEHLKNNDIPVVGYKGSEAATSRTKDKQYAFANNRTKALWRFREALDPDQEGGSPIALPPHHPNLVADLTAPTFEVRNGKIHAEPKEKVCARIGRSTDEGDAVVMAWAHGNTIANIKNGNWRGNQSKPKVNISHASKRRRR
jgi:LAGLIDADG DNA endonuclease family protein